VYTGEQMRRRGGWGRRWVLGAVSVFAGIGLAILFEPAPASATICRNEREAYALHFERIEAIDGGDAEGQRRYWSEEGLFVETMPCRGLLFLASPWWETEVECVSRP
jgi:hypothetical protein